MRIVDLLNEDLTAYHGSPHNFKKFANHRINREGLYGWGIYLTTSHRYAMLYAKRGKTLSLGEIMFLLGFDQSGWVYEVSVDESNGRILEMDGLDEELQMKIERAWPTQYREKLSSKMGSINNQGLYDFVYSMLKNTKQTSQWFISQGIIGLKSQHIYIIYDPGRVKVVGRERIPASRLIPTN